MFRVYFQAVLRSLKKREGQWDYLQSHADCMAIPGIDH